MNQEKKAAWTRGGRERKHVATHGSVVVSVHCGTPVRAGSDQRLEIGPDGVLIQIPLFQVLRNHRLCP